MDHEEYESKMIDVVNRHCEDKGTLRVSSREDATAKKPAAKIGHHALTLIKGLACVLSGVISAATFTGAVLGFCRVPHVAGYLAVGVFVVSCSCLGFAVASMYLMGTLIKNRGGKYVEK